MLCSPKSRARTHSIHVHRPLLGRIDPDDVWMHPDDANARGIVDGDRVRVLTDRRATVLPVKVTADIARGVVSIKEGAWFAPDGDGIDGSGCGNALTGDRPAPCHDVQHKPRLDRTRPDVIATDRPQARAAGTAGPSLRLWQSSGRVKPVIVLRPCISCFSACARSA